MSRMPRPPIRLLRRLAIAVVSGTAFSGCILRGPLTEQFGFMGRPLRDGKITPAQWGWDTARLDTISRTDSAGGLLAWWAPAPVSTPSCGGALLLHGKGKNRSEMLEIGRALQANGFSVLIPDYRGFGGSAGRSTTDGVYADASLAYQSLRARLVDSLAPIVVVGHSMGTALAARVSRENTPAATVYMSPFTRISSIVRARAGAIGPRLFDTTMFAFNPIDDAVAVPGRALIVIAGRDLLIPRAESDRFIAHLPQSAVVRVDRATHNGVLSDSLAVSAVTDSLDAWTACAARRRSAGAP
jgi:uncharacterized protein